jgi:hypothetical protein
MARGLEATGPGDQLMAAVRTLLSNQPSVLSIADHFAVYFNELGITVELAPNISDAEVALLKDEVAAILIGTTLPFAWILRFRRNGKSAGELFPDGFFTGERP